MSTSLFDLTGRVALVTGAARGIGAAIAQGLAEAGALVVYNGRDAVALQVALAALPAGLKSDIAAFDVTSRAEVHNGVAAIETKHGGIDILVNNAGIQRRNALADFTEDDWNAVVATNLTAPFTMAQAVAPGMQKRGGGSIINIASLLSELARPNVIAYSAAKGGVKQLTRALAVELAPHKIRVNAIAPGYFTTDMNSALLADEAFVKWVTGRTPMQRWGKPQELAGAAVFLAADASAFITGQTIFVDGGMSISV